MVTFTVAAKQELASRLNKDARFAVIRDQVEITTLNSWGFRRVRNIAFNATLLTGKEKYHFAMLNQLQPIWKKHERVKEAIESKAPHHAPSTDGPFGWFQVRRLRSCSSRNFRTICYPIERDSL